MKEFFELIQMLYATYSNSSPIARNLKFKNWKSKIVPLGWRFCDPWVGVLAARGWRFGGPGLAFRRLVLIGWITSANQNVSQKRQPPWRGIVNPHGAESPTPMAPERQPRGTIFLFSIFNLQISRDRGRAGTSGIHHSNQLGKLFHINTTCIFSEPSL